MDDPNFKCFRIPAPTEPVTETTTKKHDEMVEWMHEEYHTENWNGDECGVVLEDQLDDDGCPMVCWPGDWITSIPTGSGEERRFVRLPRKARKMRVCQMPDDTELELWVWELPNGQAVYLYDGREPRLTTLSVDKDSNRGVWLPGGQK